MRPYREVLTSWGITSSEFPLAAPQAMDRLKDKVRALTPRTSGVALEVTITRLNEVLRGWFGYFQHSHCTTFPTMDSYIRGRLRSILRKRRGGRGRARGPIIVGGTTTTLPSWACST